MAASSTARGYGYRHQKLREQWRPTVEAGEVDCSRCGEWIEPGTPWDLGHDDDDRTVYRGPEHATCNRRAGAEKRNGRTDYRARAVRPRRASRDW